MPSHPDLWRRICKHAPGAEQHVLLRDKLRREHGWRRDFISLALDEYRRFTYLATIAAHPVTPSSVVDQVWHQHLTFSRDYWQVFCPVVLQRPLHHDPGEQTGRVRMATQYQATLALYREEFGEPPAVIWEATRTRTTASLWPAGLGAGMLITGAALAAEASSRSDYDGWIAFGALAVVVYVLWWVFRTPASRQRRRRDDRSGSGCGSSCSSASCSGGSSCGGGGD